jgi:hypothetical protein
VELSFVEQIMKLGPLGPLLGVGFAVATRLFDKFTRSARRRLKKKDILESLLILKELKAGSGHPQHHHLEYFLKQEINRKAKQLTKSRNISWGRILFVTVSGMALGSIATFLFTHQKEVGILASTLSATLWASISTIITFIVSIIRQRATLKQRDRKREFDEESLYIEYLESLDDLLASRAKEDESDSGPANR